MENKLLEIINFYKNYVKELSESYKDITTGEGQEPYEWQRENLAQECNKIEDQVIDPLQEVLDFIKKNMGNPQRPRLNIHDDLEDEMCAHIERTAKNVSLIVMSPQTWQKLCKGFVGNESYKNDALLKYKGIRVLLGLDMVDGLFEVL